jgi:hypothetical protein
MWRFVSCVLVFQSLVWYLCACVSLDVLVLRGLLADSFCAIFVYLRFGVLFHWSRYWFVTALHLSTISYRPMREGFARCVPGFRVVVTFGLWLVRITCSNGITPLYLSTVSYRPCLSVKVSQISICSNGKTHTTYGCKLLLCSWGCLQIAPETSRANVKKK